jgi:hypothetical protein
MSTTTDDRKQDPVSGLLRDVELKAMPRCTRCNLTYTPAKSTSALRLTYCSFFCELGDLGFSMNGLETMELVKKSAVENPIPPEPIAVD